MPAIERERPERPAAAVSRLQAVERAEAYARAHPGTPVSVATLSRIVGLSERSLRDAFYGVRGMGPKRSLLAGRLLEAHRALSEPARTTTVTGIATRYGFYELGRFAATYRRKFGEAPSATLRATVGKSAEQKHNTKGHADVCTR